MYSADGDPDLSNDFPKSQMFSRYIFKKCTVQMVGWRSFFECGVGERKLPECSVPFSSISCSLTATPITLPVISEVITDWLPGENPPVQQPVMGIFL